MAFALGAAEVRQQQHLGATLAEFEDGRRHRAGAGKVGRPALGHRQVEVHPHQRTLVGEILRQVIEGLETGHRSLPEYSPTGGGSSRASD